MKTSKKLKAVTLILVIVLITILSFLGVYNITKVNGSNLVKDYAVGMDLKGKKLLRLKVDDTVNEVTYDSEGNKVEKQEDEGEYNVVQEPVNNPESLTKENYKKSKKIIEDRLNYMEAQEYKIRFNEENGDVELEAIDDELIDYITEAIRIKGDFKIIDAETNEVLMDRSLVKKSKVVYSSQSSEGTSVHIDIEFKKDGSKKLEELSRTYIQTIEQEVDDEGNTQNKTKEKKITVKVDDTDLVSTYFSEPLTNGHLYINVGRATTDSELLRRYALQASIYSAVIQSDTMPVTYTIEQNIFLVSNIKSEIIPTVAIIALAIEVAILIVLYRVKGIIASVLQIGYVALVLLVLKYANVCITLEGLFAIVLVSHINTILIARILHKSRKNENMAKTINEEIVKLINASIPVLIMAIVFCFVKWLEISSFGMVTFWSYIILFIYNIVFTKGILKNI